MIRTIFILLVGLTLAMPAWAGGATSHFVRLTPHGSIVQAGKFQLNLGEADNSAAPTAWQGPIVVTDSKRHTCNVSADVSIVTNPIFLAHGNLLYINTYSGSENTLYIVNAQTCAIKWTSPAFAGIPRITDNTLYLPDVKTYSIDPEGVPAN
jgi:hypothetical protein